MSIVKKAWITEHDSGLSALTVESLHVTEKFMRVKSYEMEYPEVPSKNNPLRHVIVLSLFDDEDLKKILLAITKHLGYDIQE